MKSMLNDTLYGLGGICLVQLFLIIISFIFKTDMSFRGVQAYLILATGIFLGSFIKEKTIRR